MKQKWERARSILPPPCCRSSGGDKLGPSALLLTLRQKLLHLHLEWGMWSQELNVTGGIYTHTSDRKLAASCYKSNWNMRINNLLDFDLQSWCLRSHLVRIFAEAENFLDSKKGYVDVLLYRPAASVCKQNNSCVCVYILHLISYDNT